MLSFCKRPKKHQWQSECLSSFSEAGLSFRLCCNSERRDEAAADLDDIIQAFVKLDEVDKIPDTYVRLVI